MDNFARIQPVVSPSSFSQEAKKRARAAGETNAIKTSRFNWTYPFFVVYTNFAKNWFNFLILFAGSIQYAAGYPPMLFVLFTVVFLQMSAQIVWQDWKRLRSD